MSPPRDPSECVVEVGRLRLELERVATTPGSRSKEIAKIFGDLRRVAAVGEALANEETPR